MKPKQVSDEWLDWCFSCKEDISKNENYVFYKGKFYHLNCFLTEHDLALEIDDTDITEE